MERVQESANALLGCLSKNEDKLEPMYESSLGAPHVTTQFYAAKDCLQYYLHQDTHTHTEREREREEQKTVHRYCT